MSDQTAAQKAAYQSQIYRCRTRITGLEDDIRSLKNRKSKLEEGLSHLNQRKQHLSSQYDAHLTSLNKITSGSALKAAVAVKKELGDYAQQHWWPNTSSQINEVNNSVCRAIEDLETQIA